MWNRRSQSRYRVPCISTAFSSPSSPLLIVHRAFIQSQREESHQKNARQGQAHVHRPALGRMIKVWMLLIKNQWKMMTKRMMTTQKVRLWPVVCVVGVCVFISPAFKMHFICLPSLSLSLSLSLVLSLYLFLSAHTHTHTSWFFFFFPCLLFMLIFH